MTMMNELLFYAGAFVAILIAVSVVTFVVLRLRARGLSGVSRKKVRAAWNHARQMSDPVHSVMEADKVLDLALGELGFAGSLGEKLKKAGPRFSDAQAVWNAHKLRNTLAHEAGAHVPDAQAARALAAFERALRDLGM